MTNLQNCNNHQWLALMAGNSRLHWGYFENNELQATWDTEHLSYPLTTNQLPQALLLPHLPNNLPLYLASVVPSQTELWQAYFPTKLITLEQIPLRKLYQTLGIDRALAVLGTEEKYGFPCLVIDAGTALTFTGVDDDRALVGGAILPGLKLQFQMLARGTAALPEGNLPPVLPNRWATTTNHSIESGILYTILAGIQSFIKDWLKKFSGSQVVLTGGDSQQIFTYLTIETESNKILLNHLNQDSNLIFKGFKKLMIK